MLRLHGDNWIAVEFKPQDLWIGAFWEHRHCDYYTAIGRVGLETHVWICLLPCFPIHIIHAKLYTKRNQPDSNQGGVDD